MHHVRKILCDDCNVPTTVFDGVMATMIASNERMRFVVSVRVHEFEGSMDDEGKHCMTWRVSAREVRLTRHLRDPADCVTAEFRRRFERTDDDTEPKLRDEPWGVAIDAFRGRETAEALAMQPVRDMFPNDSTEDVCDSMEIHAELVFGAMRMSAEADVTALSNEVTEEMGDGDANGFMAPATMHREGTWNALEAVLTRQWTGMLDIRLNNSAS